MADGTQSIVTSSSQSVRPPYLLFTILCVGTALGGLTQTALNTMASTVLSDLNTDIGWGQWLTTIYIFAMEAAVPLASFVQRRFSVRALMLSSFSLYVIGAFCDFLSVNFPMLIIGRVLEALSTGTLMPLLQTIAMTRFPENRHGTAMGFAGIALGFAPNIGPTIGGAIAIGVGWRMLFLILALTSCAFVILTLAFVRDRVPADPGARLDGYSLGLSTVGSGGLLLGFTAAANVSFANPLVWASIALGLVVVFVFMRRQKRLTEGEGSCGTTQKHPLVNAGIFAFREFRASFVAQCLLYGCFMGMTLIIPLFVVEGGGHSELDAGLVLLPGAIAALIFEPGAGAASDRFGSRRVALFGGAFLSAGALSIAFVPSDAPLWIPAVCQAVRCVGLTTLIPTTTAYGLGVLGQRGLTTDGSAFLIMSRQIAAALATAVMVFLLKMLANGGNAILGYHAALGFSGLLALGCLAVCMAGIREKRR